MIGKTKKFVCLLLCICMTVAFTGCAQADSYYRITYIIDEVIFELTVEYGKLYSLEMTPKREGYEFAGLFDAEQGGTKYIDSSGLSVGAWKEKTDKRLYARWTPKKYTLRLDYQAGIKGEETRTVTYGEPLAVLPISYKEHYEFCGWYTLPDCLGDRISDENGLPLARLPAATTDTIVLYAGFEGKPLALTFYWGEGTDAEHTAVTVRYGQTLLEIQPWRLFDGKIVSEWSTQPAGYGERLRASDPVTKAMELYAYAYSVAVCFDCRGGTRVDGILGAEGDQIELPVSTRPGYRFGGWKTETGSIFEATTMPKSAVIVYAIWQRTLQLKDGENITVESAEPGKWVQLPLPRRSGWEFAGWYDEKRQAVKLPYEMPDTNVTLTAGWYEIKTETENVSMEEHSVYSSGGSFSTKFSAEVPDSWPRDAKINVCYEIKSKNCYPKFSIYSNGSYDSQYLLGSEDYPTGMENYRAYYQGILNKYPVLYFKLSSYKSPGSFAAYSWFYKNLCLKYSFTEESKLKFF